LIGKSYESRDTQLNLYILHLLVYEPEGLLLVMITVSNKTMSIRDKEGKNIDIKILDSWHHFALQIYPRIQFTYNKDFFKSFKDTTFLESFFISLGNRDLKLQASFRGVVWLHTLYHSHFTSYDYITYGLEKFLFNEPYFPQGIINETSTYNLTFSPEDNLYTFRFRYKLVAIHNRDVLHSCKLFEIIGSEGTQYTYVELLIQQNSYQLCGGDNKCHKYANIEEIILNFIVDQDQKKFLLSCFDNDIESPFHSEILTLSFGGNNSCTFFPLNIQLYQGGSSYYKPEETGCSKRDIFLNECLDCNSGYDYDTTKRDCIPASSYDVCYKKVCLNGFESPALDFCKNQSGWSCRECQEGYKGIPVSNLEVLIEICLEECPPKQFLQITNEEYKCEDCLVPHCKLCKTSEICAECEPGHYLNSAQCVEDCKPGYTLKNNCYEKCPLKTYDAPNKTCLDCPQGCSSCNSPTNCTACESTHILFDDFCYEKECYFEEKECFCRDPCIKCGFYPSASGSKELVCTKCAEGFHIYQGKCLEKCPPGTIDLIGACQECDTFLNRTDGTQECFVGSCPAGYYRDKDGMCQKCSDDCEVCYPDSSLHTPGCIQCKPNLMVNHKQCKESCPKYHYSFFRTCYLGDRKCDRWGVQPCEKCLQNDVYYTLEEESKTCQICEVKPPFRLRMLISIVNSVESPTKFNVFPFILTKDETCNPCNENCLECASNFKCQKCVQGYYLSLNGTCSRVCPKGSVATEDMNCESCPELCEYCSSLNHCIICMFGTLNYNGSCQYLDRQPRFE